VTRRGKEGCIPRTAEKEGTTPSTRQLSRRCFREKEELSFSAVLLEDKQAMPVIRRHHLKGQQKASGHLPPHEKEKKAAPTYLINRGEFPHRSRTHSSASPEKRKILFHCRRESLETARTADRRKGKAPTGSTKKMVTTVARRGKEDPKRSSAAWEGAHQRVDPANLLKKRPLVYCQRGSPKPAPGAS